MALCPRAHACGASRSSRFFMTLLNSYVLEKKTEDELAKRTAEEAWHYLRYLLNSAFFFNPLCLKSFVVLWQVVDLFNVEKESFHNNSVKSLNGNNLYMPSV